MKYVIILILCICSSLQMQGALSALKGGKSNLALHLDGKDNNVRTGMGILEPSWTLESWIKGDDCQWDSLEVIIGGGEYSELNWVDYLPLVVKEGKIHSSRANLSSPQTLDDQWHHVALTCDGKQTILYLDGKQVDKADTATAILPGAIGVHDVYYTFGGLIDEVRVWRSALPEQTIRRWMNRPVEATHPAFKSLWGYYNFDDLKDETSVNWVGKGHQAYHIRNGRNKYNEKAPLAHAVPNDNPAFKELDGNQQLFNAVIIQSEWDADQGSKNDQALKLRIAVQGSKNPLKLTELKLDFTGTTDLADIEQIHIYSTGSEARSTQRKELFGNGHTPEQSLTLRPTHGEEILLQPGINYFLLTFDVRSKATPGHTLYASVPFFKLNGKKIIPETSAEEVRKQVTCNNQTQSNIVKVLQWNIWHGGIHLGNEGQQRVLDLIRSSRADVIMMQEAYGIQQMLADSLGYHLKTHSLKDNLAMYSRFPLEAIAWREPFKSNPAKITLPNGKRIMFVDCWLRYAYRPEYTSGYAEKGLDPSVWVAEDSILPLPDIRNIYTKDIAPNLETDMPVIVTGDFNSCSHLDWTERAKPLHHGYGPVAFPASRYMLENGFKDSFREKNPDEVAYQGGTVAAIYGQMQMSRIDFIYYKGGLKVLSSKIVRTAPEIDYVWASDHAAVLTVFEVE